MKFGSVRQFFFHFYVCEKVEEISIAYPIYFCVRFKQ